MLTLIGSRGQLQHSSSCRYRSCACVRAARGVRQVVVDVRCSATASAAAGAAAALLLACAPAQGTDLPVPLAAAAATGATSSASPVGAAWQSQVDTAAAPAAQAAPPLAATADQAAVESSSTAVPAGELAAALEPPAPSSLSDVTLSLSLPQLSGLPAMEQMQLPGVSALELSGLGLPGVELPPLELPSVDMSQLAPVQLDEQLLDDIKAVVEQSLEATNLTEQNYGGIGPSTSGAWMGQADPLCGWWEAYCVNLQQRPLYTKILTGMVGTLLGDLAAQCSALLSHKAVSTVRTVRGRPAPIQPPPEFDWQRTARLVAYSALIGTPIAQAWFGFLDAAVLPDQPTSPAAVLCKMLLDQCLMAPFGTTLFFATMRAAEGSPRDAMPTALSKLRPALLANYAVWPLFNVFNFAFVPSTQRILFVNVLNIAWTAYMSNLASSEGQADCPASVQPQQAANQQPAQPRRPALLRLSRRAMTASPERW